MSTTAPTTTVFLALGSNMGDRAAHLASAREALARLPRTGLLAASRVEETLPLDGRVQPRYLNQMVMLDTALTPHQLLDACLRIERDAGRTRNGGRWASRTLDIDIVFFGERTISDERLTIPHPELPNRDFWHRELEELGADV